MASVILRLPAVKHRTGLARSTIYLRIAQGVFPKQISLGDRAVGWIEEEIEAWLSHQIERSRKLPIANTMKIQSLPSNQQLNFIQTKNLGVKPL